MTTERKPCTLHGDDECFLCYPDWLAEIDAEPQPAHSNAPQIAECSEAEMQAFLNNMFSRVYPQFYSR
jgi:hypothetical protein